MGIPVIVAGEAWIRNKGISIDAKSEPDYFKILDRLPYEKKLSEKEVKRARMYAYHFFFRRMIPVEAIRPTTGWPPYQLEIKSLKDIIPEKDRGLDVICKGILLKKEFIFPAETF
jgi:hypothetical protein